MLTLYKISECITDMLLHKVTLEEGCSRHNSLQGEFV